MRQVDGSVLVSYTATGAGVYDLKVEHNARIVSRCVLCHPGTTSVEHCLVDASELAKWQVGTPAVLTVRRTDSFGNPVGRSPGEARFMAHANGPGPVKVPHSTLLRFILLRSAPLRVATPLHSTSLHSALIFCWIPEGVAIGVFL